MKSLFGLMIALAMTVAILFIVSKDVLVNVVQAKRAATSQSINTSTPPPIVSISVCSSDSHDGTLAQGSCTPGTFDTHLIVLGSGVKSVNSSGLGVGIVPDEHSTVFAPGTLGSNSDYLFFLATGANGHPNIGVSVLSGGRNPDNNGQWHLDFPSPSPTPAYGWYGSDFGPVFEHSTTPGVCPATPDGKATDQDEISIWVMPLPDRL